MARSVPRKTAGSSQPKADSNGSISRSRSATVPGTVFSNAKTLNTTATAAITTSSGSRKRKLADLKESASTPTYSSSANNPSAKNITLTAPDVSLTRNKKKQKKEQEEKRLRTFRKKAPQSFLEKLERAQSQRMIVVGRTRHEKDEYPTEEIDIVGSTGNIYRVTVDKKPSCTCPDSRKGNECKHKVYALHTILKAPEHLQYQLALLSSELKEIFEGAPPIPTDAATGEDNDGKRKPADGECPICYMDLQEEENELVWCKAACGNNMHKSCFEQWVASQRGNTVKCVYCRTPWEMEKEDLEKIKKAGALNSEGYINVADHFGMSTMRDYSSYHRPWVRRNFGMGW